MRSACGTTCSHVVSKKARAGLSNSTVRGRLQGKAPERAFDSPMRYLCLCYAEEETLDALPPRELDALFVAQVACDEMLRENGHVVASEALASVRTATTIRVRSGKVSVTDGPFAETKEQLGGYYLINARDLNDAMKVAAKIPSAKLGTIEIRPIQEFDQQA